MPLTERAMNCCPTNTGRSNSRVKSTAKKPSAGNKENSNSHNFCQTTRSPLEALKITASAKEKSRSKDDSEGLQAMTTATQEESECKIEEQLRSDNEVLLVAPQLLSLPPNIEGFCEKAQHVLQKRLLKDAVAILKSANCAKIEEVRKKAMSADQEKLKLMTFCDKIKGLINTSLHKRFLMWNYNTGVKRNPNAIRKRILGRAFVILDRYEARENMKTCLAYWRVMTIFSAQCSK